MGHTRSVHCRVGGRLSTNINLHACILRRAAFRKVEDQISRTDAYSNPAEFANLRIKQITNSEYDPKAYPKPDETPEEITITCRHLRGLRERLRWQIKKPFIYCCHTLLVARIYLLHPSLVPLQDP